jgi:hypothetical protein
LIPDHRAIADSLHHVAISLYSDNLSLAMPMLLRTKEIREMVFGHDHPLVAVSLSAMARMYEAHNHRDLAIPIYQDVLRIQEKVFGPSASEAIQARDYLDMGYQVKPNQGVDRVPGSKEVSAEDRSTITFRQRQLICQSHSFPINPLDHRLNQ